MVRFAACFSGKRAAAAFNGAGAVLGAKNLKLIAVRGTKGVKVKDPKGLENACWEIMDRMMKGPFYWLFAEQGALGTINAAYRRVGIHESKNSQIFYISDEDFKKTAYQGFSRRKKKNFACTGCFVHCKHVVEIKSGPYAGTKLKGTEFYPSIALGTNLGIYNADFYIRAVLECDKYGIDVGNAGSVMGFAAELYEKGLITKEDTDGLELTWGNEKAFLELIGKIGLREGFGGVLADGIDQAADQIGKEAKRYAVTSKGQPLSAGGVGYLAGSTISWVTSTNGNFVKGITTFEWGEGMIPGLAEKRAKEYFGIPTLHPESFEGKERVVIWA